MGIQWPASSAKHGIPRQDALYAIRHSVYTSSRVKVDPTRANHPRRVFIGPAHGQTERLIEVLVELRGGDMYVYHVMPLGAYYRRQMEEEQR